MRNICRRELISWNPDDNFDRVSAMGMLMILRAEREKFEQHKYEDKIKVLIEYKNLEAAKRFILDIIDEFSLVGNNDSFQYFYFDEVKYA